MCTVCKKKYDVMLEHGTLHYGDEVGAAGSLCSRECLVVFVLRNNDQE